MVDNLREQGANRMKELRRNSVLSQSNNTGSKAPTTGTINNIVVFIRFSDQAEFTQNISTYNSMFNGTTGNTMQSYFWEASYNQVSVSSTFYPPATTTVVSWQDSHPRNYYVPYDASTNPDGYQDSQRTAREHTLLANAINGVNSQIPSGLVVDADNNGNVDNVCFIIQGSTTAWSTLLWPHKWSLYSVSAYINNKRVNEYNFQLSGSLSNCSVLCHEMFHSMGAPDLYRYENDDISPAGTWDLMNSNSNPPQHMTAFMKWKYGKWISGTEIPTLYTSGTYTLNNIKSPTGQFFRINSPVSSTEYYVVEFRKKTVSGTFDSQIPGSGLLVYRINTTCGNGNADGPPDELYIYRPGGTPTTNGSYTTAHFSSETGRTSFNNTTNPSCFLTDGTLGNISISAIGSSAGSAISFYYTFDNAPTNLTGSSVNSSISLAWQAPQIGTPVSYKIYRNGVFYVSTSALSYTDNNVVVGTGYSYYVTAVFTNPTTETSASNTVNITASDLSIQTIGTETNTGKGLPIEPYYGYTYSQSIYLQPEINTASKSISKLAWQYNGNSAWTDNIRIWLGHTSLSSFASTSAWIPASQMTLVYDGTLSTTQTAGAWVEVTLDTLFNYNNTQNLVIAVDENTSGYHASGDEFYNTTVSGNRSIHFYSDTTNPDPAAPPTSGSYLYTKAFVPNLKLTFTTNPVFSFTPSQVDFGQVTINTYNLQTARITNTGNGRLTVSSISLSNNQFSLTGLPSLPASLTEGQFFEFQLIYNPQAAGSHSAVLTVTDNLARQTQSVDVIGSSLNTAVTVFPWTCDFNAWTPENWYLPAGTHNWSQHFNASTGNYSAKAGLSGWTGGSSAILITPPLHPSLTSKLSFKWSHLYNAAHPADSLKVYYSLNRYNWSLLWQTGNSAFNSADGATATSPGTYVVQDVALPANHTSQNFFLKIEAISGNGSDVFVDDVSIRSLQAIIINPTTMAFGSVAVGTSPSQVMTIQNTGESALTGTISTPTVYTVSDGTRDEERNVLAFSIPGNSSQDFDIHMTPAAAISYNGFVYVYSNDPVQPTKMVRVTGTGFLPARLTVSPGSVAESAVYGSTTQQQILLTNPGNLALNYTIQVTEPARTGAQRPMIGRNTDWLSLSTLSGTINVGQSQNLNLTFNAQMAGPGTHHALLNFSSNDPVNPVIQVLVTYTVTAAMTQPNILPGVNSVTISWQPVAGAVSYKVYKCTTPDGTFELVGNVTQPVFVETGTTATGFFHVRAVFE